MDNKPWWWDLTVQTLHLSVPLTVNPSVSCQKVIEILKEKGFDQAPVISESGEIVGMATLRGILSSMMAGKVNPSDAISSVLCKDHKLVNLTDTLGKLSCILETDHFCLVEYDYTQYAPDGSACPKQMVFGVVTAIDLLDFITAHEGHDHSLQCPLCDIVSL